MVAPAASPICLHEKLMTSGLDDIASPVVVEPSMIWTIHPCPFVSRRSLGLADLTNSRHFPTMYALSFVDSGDMRALGILSRYDDLDNGAISLPR